MFRNSAWHDFCTLHRLNIFSQLLSTCLLPCCFLFASFSHIKVKHKDKEDLLRHLLILKLSCRYPWNVNCFGAKLYAIELYWLLKVTNIVNLLQHASILCFPRTTTERANYRQSVICYKAAKFKTEGCIEPLNGQCLVLQESDRQ